MAADSATGPNLIVVHPHNLGRYLGCYGWNVDTPNADALAAESLKLENLYCTAPHCSPARGSLWTGRYPHNNGLIGLAHLGWSLKESERTLVDHLNDEGYRTHLFGLQHIAGDAEDVGYQHVQGSTHDFNVDEPADTVAERVEAFLESDDAAGDQPFFASVGFSEVHRQPLVERCLDCGWTFDLPGYGSDDPDEVDPLPYLPDRPGIREDLAHFHGMIHAIDDGLGRVVDALDASGLADDTILVFTTDHGIGFPRAMGTCYDPGVETFMLVRWPGVTDPGTTDDHLLSQVDFLPTVLDLVDAPAPEGIDGRSFAPLVTGDGEYEPREDVFLEFTWHSKYMPMRAVRTNRYKYVRNFGDQPLVYIPAPLFSAPAGKEVRNEFYGEQRPEEELYDLDADPLEQENLAEGPAHADTLSELRGRVQAWMEDTDDRLLEGDWPPSKKQMERIQKSPWVPRSVDEFC